MPQKGPITIALGEFITEACGWRLTHTATIDDAELYPPFAVHRSPLIKPDRTIGGFSQDYQITHVATGQRAALNLTHASACKVARAWSKLEGLDALTHPDFAHGPQFESLRQKLNAIRVAVVRSERERKDAAALAKVQR